MKILDRYILKELVKFFILSVFILTLVLFLDQLHYLSELILNRGDLTINVNSISIYYTLCTISISSWVNP